MMQPQPPMMPAERYTLADESHLRTISVLHFVLAGFGFLGLVFVFIHFALMATVLASIPASSTSSTTASVTYSSAEALIQGEVGANTDPTQTPESELSIPSSISISPTPALFTTPPKTPIKNFVWIIGAFYLLIALVLLAFSVCNVLSGLWIKRRKNQSFSFVVAAVNCILFPLGTALGVFTFIVLARPSLEANYQFSREG